MLPLLTWCLNPDAFEVFFWLITFFVDLPLFKPVELLGKITGCDVTILNGNKDHE